MRPILDNDRVCIHDALPPHRGVRYDGGTQQSGVAMIDKIKVVETADLSVEKVPYAVHHQLGARDRATNLIECVNKVR
jgi:hypothetical protein